MGVIRTDTSDVEQILWKTDGSRLLTIECIKPEWVPLTFPGLSQAYLAN